MKFIVAPAAERDLREIADRIARDDPDIAARFVAQIEARARELIETPLAFPHVPHLRHLDVRKRGYGDYLILYRVNRGTLRILRIVHGRRDYAALFD